MKYKINKNQSSLIKKPAISKRGGGGLSLIPSSANNQMLNIRENSLKKDNWNIYVGDCQYKTNFFLQFKNQYTKSIYENHLFNSSLYSIRILLIVMGILDIFFFGYEWCETEGCFFRRLFVILLAIGSLFSTTNYSKTL